MAPYYDLGTYRRSISTNIPEAQTWFDRGLLWCYAYNHEESVRCFEKAAELDKSCAMAHWGIAYAMGCNYNRTWQDFSKKELEDVLKVCTKATQEALKRLEGSSAVEVALIKALERRYQRDCIVTDEEFCVWNDDYAAAMRAVYRSFPSDLDVTTLFAEALINRTPWQLWNLKTGEAADGADTLEAVQVLESAMQQMYKAKLELHVGILHMYIHTMEMSPFPERALRAADGLRTAIADAGHLLHMPSHIDILCGHYHNAVVANERAIVADDKYLADKGEFNFYTFYRAHDYHFKIYAAMFLGQYETAISTVNTLIGSISDEMMRTESPKMVDSLEGIVSMHLHVYIRFGKWQSILDEPFPKDETFYCVSTTMLHYAKAVAYAALGEISKAEQHKFKFELSYQTIPDSRRIFNNTCLDVLSIAREMMNGEIEYRKRNYGLAFKHLEQSVYLDDNLNYAEPWGWMQPTRHALGALLLEQGQIQKALEIYRADLGLDNTLPRPSQHPDNVWSLHGYVECLNKLGKKEEALAMQARLDIVIARADVPIKASCFCRLEHNDSACCD